MLSDRRIEEIFRSGGMVGSTRLAIRLVRLVEPAIEVELNLELVALRAVNKFQLAELEELRSNYTKALAEISRLRADADAYQFVNNQATRL